MYTFESLERAHYFEVMISGPYYAWELNEKQASVRIILWL